MRVRVSPSAQDLKYPAFAGYFKYLYLGETRKPERCRVSRRGREAGSRKFPSDGEEIIRDRVSPSAQDLKYPAFAGYFKYLYLGETRKPERCGVSLLEEKARGIGVKNHYFTKIPRGYRFVAGP